MNKRTSIQLKPDLNKIQEAILYLMSLADGLTQYDIVKTLFLADRAHLNKHGRPVTFDNYVAMEHGPVPSLAYDSLKPEWDYGKRFGSERPWLSAPDAFNAKTNHYTRRREPDLDYLSSTDLDELRSALGTVRSLTFPQLRRLTHGDPAYKEAWESRGSKYSEPMLLPLLIEEGGEELAANLAYISAHS